MKVLPTFGKQVLSFLLLTSLCSTTTIAQLRSDQGMQEDLLGKWYLSETVEEQEIYTRSESLRPHFSFWEDGSMTYTHCQDICGCMAAVYYGDWKKRKNRVKITYDVFEDGLILQALTSISDINLKRNIKILDYNADTLRIRPYKHYQAVKNR
jgi:hypothetical protein